MCNVIKAGMSKWAKLVQILVNDKRLQNAVLTSHTPTSGTWDLPGYFKHQKACLVEIEQTARKLETNAHANFLTAENMAYQCMEDGWWNMPTLTLSWLVVPIRHNVETKSET